MTGAISYATFRTTDPEEGHDYLRRVYVENDLRLSGSTEDFVLAADLLTFAGVSLGHTYHSMAARLTAGQGQDTISIAQARRSGGRLRAASADLPIGRQSSVLAPPHRPFRVDWKTLDVDVAVFSPRVLSELGAVNGDPTTPRTFAFTAAGSRAAADTWRRVSTLVRRTALANRTNPDAILLADELAKLLASTALTCFPHRGLESAAAMPGRAGPASLRRAVSYIDEHLREPLSCGEIAVAARVSPRALNQTFNRHLGTTPMGYVRQARLDQAHQDLCSSEAAAEQTVSTIAARWGFYSLPRFGALYRKVYGHPPSQTLRRTSSLVR